MSSNGSKNRFSDRLWHLVIGGAVAVGVAAGSYGAAWATTQALSGPGPRGGPPAGAVPPRLAGTKPPGAHAAPAPPAPGPPGGGLLTAIGSSSITVEGPNGKSTTFTTVSSTTYSQAGHSISRSGLHVDDPVTVLPKSSGSKTSGASDLTAGAVDVLRSQLRGVVDSVSSGTITITGFQGFKRTIATSSGTRYIKGTTTVSRSAVSDGEVVGALGTLMSGGTELNAQLVVIGQPSPAGMLPPHAPPLAPPPSGSIPKPASGHSTAK